MQPQVCDSRGPARLISSAAVRSLPCRSGDAMDFVWRGIAIGCLLLVAPATAPAQSSPQELADKAHNVFKAHCYRCHGQNGANEGGLNYIVDLQQLVNRRKVVPGEPAKSRLLKRMLDA